ncbi:single-stranded-DNA-specific exonuclease RecJ [Geminocystis sp. NIES-3709]|uniref:single-stranded-DNA-specific exonuclease RecJ n=1 Tax=Geminocystis sp. NIES-3709 TaxID=1617448 RepID=UPI0005FC7824|nr:single-stranded-DNA-specific exonuclease RecJ [Geminocystis sp. NIES-3709]BAQ66313.1 single-stranded-DNA-specific exonuclease RecJ [Geminocystis sp. NIES-3709]
MEYNLPCQRWKFYSQNPTLVNQLVERLGLSSIVAQVIINRGMVNVDDVQSYVNPEIINLPSPLTEFPDLPKSIEILKNTIESKQKIAICGDYDADGMTSTALLLRGLRHLGAKVDYAIPSRMKDGYGINKRIVEEFKEEGVSLVLTVDNGISAYDAIARAKELGLQVIITDHHDLPLKLPPADAILNPKLLPKTSPYYGLAGVGVAYVLAVTLAQNLNKLQGLTKPLLELYTVGTIADMAPLTGVNRRWLKRGLKLLSKSDILGIKSLITLAEVDGKKKQLNSDDIGFKIGPRINTIGRLDDPQIVIELLTTDDEKVAITRAMQCNQSNQTRQNLTKQIEQEAIKIIEEKQINWQDDRLLLIVHENWHHGIIGLVASRLLEKYGVPVFIGTYEEDNPELIRGSARGIEEFNIFSALQYCDDLLSKYGGHKAAGGFGFPTKNLPLIHDRLREFAHQTLIPEYLKPLIKIDTEISFKDITFQLLKEIDSLYPWGIENNEPIFSSLNVKVSSQQLTKTGEHLQLKFVQDDIELKAIAWRWNQYYPLPPTIDIAYKIKENDWNGNKSIQLDIVGVRKS